VELADFVQQKRTLVSVGSGGVGKTTVSASIALWAAVHGRRSLVLTVDPARRLASALGIDAFAEEQRRIDDAPLRPDGVRFAAPLHAAMLDTKSTFDRVVTRYAPDEATRERILGNKYYQQASTALAGSQEYMAAEKLYEIREDRPDEHDLILLDTPPSRHALDFLSAPRRMMGLMDSRAVQAFLRATAALGSSKRGVGRLNRFILGGVGRFLGTGVFLEILDFLESFSSMSEGFAARSRRVEELLRSPDVAFLVVTSPEAAAVDEALFLRETILAEGMPFGAFVVNRVQVEYVPRDRQEGLEERVVAAMCAERALGLYSPAIVERVARRVVRRFRDVQGLVRNHTAALAQLQQAAGADRVFVVPHFAEDIHDLSGLYRFARVLAASTGDGAGGAAAAAAAAAAGRGERFCG
jgi:anion-transporting  ArsA/GET3 family ATPase